MTSLDANLLLYACNEDSPWHGPSWNFVRELGSREDVAISEFVLVELYTLLRNPSVVTKPLTSVEAVEVIQSYRHHPHWALLGFDPDSKGLHEELWRAAKQPGFARRRIYDMRMALSLRRQGVAEFATANMKDFEGFGFKRVWNPVDTGMA